MIAKTAAATTVRRRMSSVVLLLGIVGLAGVSTPAAPAPPPVTQTLMQQAYLKALNAGTGDQLGISIAISGDTAVVGTINEDSNATGVNGNAADNSALTSGAAYVYVRNAGVWTQQAYLKASNTEANDQFGGAVAISGNTIVVGAAAEDSNAFGVNGIQTNNSTAQAGAAYVFVRSGTTWTQQAYLKASNRTGVGGGDQFGISVAVSGDTVAVGAWGEDSSATGVNGTGTATATGSGAVYVFARSGTTWTQQAYLKSSNSEGPVAGAAAPFGDEFGYSVGISGDTIVVGATGPFGGGEDSGATGVNGNQTDNSVPDSGAAYVFVRNGTTWTQQAYLKASNTGANDRFGLSVAVSNDTVVVGAYLEDSNASGVNGNQSDNSTADSGAVYVFARSGTTWAQQAYLKASNPDANDQFGRSVAVSGDRIVIGAALEDSSATGIDGSGASNTAGSAGAAYVFTRSGTTWAQDAYLKASNTGGGDQFGSAVAVSGETVISAAVGEDSSATGVNGDQTSNAAADAGAAYVFVGYVAPNSAPVANAGSDQFVPATSASGATVSLTGGASSDPDGDALTYTWREGATVIGSGAVIAPVVDFGTHTFTLTVADPSGAMSTDGVVITVADSFTISIATPPVAVATYTFGQLVAAAYTCSDTASILASCVGTAANGSGLDTGAVGSHPFTVTATNTRGDMSSMGRTYNVIPAASSVAINCPASTVYSGSALAPCTATATGAGMSPVDVTASLVYDSNIAAGTAMVSVAWSGDANHDGSSGSATFAITSAASSTTVSCTASVTYTGAALEVCTATTTGAGGLNASTTVTYTDNINVGTATAIASFAGDANHDGSTGSATFAITSAASSTTVSCTASVTYTGAALEVCTATTTGAGGLNQSTTVTYTDNLNVGTATAIASFAGDANHDGSSGSATFAITSAASSTTVSCTASVTYTGAALEVCTATTTGAGGLNQSTAVTYTNNTNVGTATATATFAGDANHDGSTASATFAITAPPSPSYSICLLYDPAKVVKSGATIPLKIRVCSAAGANQSAAAIVVTAVSLGMVSTSTTGEVVDAGNSNADGNFRYDAALGPGYIFNLKTTGLATGTYRLEVRVTNDPQPHYLFFQVK